MSTIVDKLVRELEDIYENSCLLKAVKEGNKKCLALDEQELAIMCMCIEGLGQQEGMTKGNYKSRDLFILLKNRNLGDDACADDRVKNEPVKYKKYDDPGGYQLDKMTQLLLVYYAALVLFANNENTGDYNEESKRHYFSVYAYFACICPKTFCVLFFNQIHLFMSKAHKQLPSDKLRKYLEYTEELWKGYTSLLLSERRIEVSEEVIGQFAEIMSYDEEVFFDNLIQMYNLSEDGFLAFDFMGGDTLRGYRFKTILDGIEYFKWYLKYLRDEILKNSFREENLLKKIDNILETAKILSGIFLEFLQKEGGQYSNFERRFDSIYGLLNDFHQYCNNRVKLIEA